MAKSQAQPQRRDPAPAPPPTTPPSREEPPERPVASFKYGVSGGFIEVAVWSKRMQGDHGDYTVYNTTFHRSYKVDGDEWKTSGNIRGSDIPILIHALQQAYAFVLEDRAQQAQ